MRKYYELIDSGHERHMMWREKTGQFIAERVHNKGTLPTEPDSCTFFLKALQLLPQVRNTSWKVSPMGMSCIYTIRRTTAILDARIHIYLVCFRSNALQGCVSYKPAQGLITPNDCTSSSLQQISVPTRNGSMTAGRIQCAIAGYVAGNAAKHFKNH